MARIILLDAGLIGLAVSPPENPVVALFREWLERMENSGQILLIPEITDYEVRRELIRLRATAKLKRLDNLRVKLKNAPVTEDAWLKAAEFWAIVRQRGLPTADPHALDADAILAAVASTLAGPDDQVVIATTNVVHLARFPGVDARPWPAIV